MDEQAAFDTPAFTPWARAWFSLQRRYWDSCIDLARSLGGPPSGNPWAAGWPLWGQSPEGRPAGGGGAGPGDWLQFWSGAPYWAYWRKVWEEFLPRPDESTPAQAGAASISAQQQPRGAPDDWFRALGGLNRSVTATWQALCRAWLDPFGFSTRMPGVDEGTGFPNRGLAPWSGLGTLLGMPLDNWRRVVSTYSMAPGDMEKAIRQPGSPYGPETLHRTMVGFLSMPAIGYTREWQEEVQRWGLLWLDHWQALQDYTAVVFPSVFDALERFGGKLQDPEAGSEARNSLRAFYDLWIDCSEEAYGRLSFSPQFIDAQARLSNSLFALKRQEQGMMEEFQSTLNMPTRRELDTSHRRVHHLHRRLWQVEQALEERGQEQVQSELQSLRRELDELRRRLEAALPKS